MNSHPNPLRRPATAGLRLSPAVVALLATPPVQPLPAPRRPNTHTYPAQRGGTRHPREVGQAVWLPGRDDRPLTVVNRRTRQAWERDKAGGWKPSGQRTIPPADQVSTLLAAPDGVARAVSLLRQDPRPWQDLLLTAAATATRWGCDRRRIDANQRAAADLLTATNTAPHRAVVVIDDSDVYAAAWFADASVSPDPQTAGYCCRQAQKTLAAAASGAPLEYPTGDVFGTRQQAAQQVAQWRAWQRPGQSWRVEPVGKDL